MTKGDKILSHIIGIIFGIIIGIVIGISICMLNIVKIDNKNFEEEKENISEKEIYEKLKGNADSIKNLFAFYKKDQNFNFKFNEEFELKMMLELIGSRYSKTTENYSDEIIQELNSKGFAINSEDYNNYINIITIIPEEDIKNELKNLFGDDKLYEKYIKNSNYIKSANGFALLNNTPAATGLFEVFTFSKYKLENDEFKIYYTGEVKPINSSKRTLVISFKLIDNNYYFDSISNVSD